MLAITRQCVNRCADSSPAWGLLEEARTKLLLSAIPDGAADAEEVHERCRLWEEASFKTLLARVEQQRLLINKTRSHQRAPGIEDPTRKGRKAKHMAAEGAYKKAAASMTSELMTMSSAEDSRCASELLPHSQHPGDAVFRRSNAAAQPGSFDTQPIPQLTEDDEDPLSGVR